MKKSLKYFALLLGSVFILFVFAVSSFGEDIKEWVLANVVGTQFCPSGDGKTFEDEMLVEVNKNIALPNNYIPENLLDISKIVKTTKKICLKKEALLALKIMFDDASVQGIRLAATSGFRSEKVQSKLYTALMALKGEKAKNRIAEPLHSEHQLGTTVDLSGESVGYISANDIFTGTTEELWLNNNAYKYGFVQSYPKDKISTTGYDHESWHYRFLGSEIAKQIFNSGITIQEYFDNNDKKD